MTNKELINILQTMPLDAEVYTRDIDYMKIPLTEEDIYLISTRDLSNTKRETILMIEGIIFE